MHPEEGGDTRLVGAPLQGSYSLWENHRGQGGMGAYPSHSRVFQATVSPLALRGPDWLLLCYAGSLAERYLVCEQECAARGAGVVRGAAPSACAEQAPLPA